MKEITYANVDFINYMIELYTIDRDKDFDEQYDRINKAQEQITVCLTSLEDAVEYARSMLTEPRFDFNYATITLLRWQYESISTTTDGDDELEDPTTALIIGELWSNEFSAQA